MTEIKFKPIGAFRTKIFLEIATIFVAITLALILFGGFIVVVSSFSGDSLSDSSSDDFVNFINDPESQAFFMAAYFALSLVWIIPAVFLTPFYYRSIEYTLKKDEIIIKKGIINKTIKHIPFRTITNVSSRYGPYDSILAIGTVEIETAGKSGASSSPEGKIEGIRNFFETRDLILDELRKFKTPYATTTEISLTEDDPATDFYRELLKELREIKTLMKSN